MLDVCMRTSVIVIC